MNGRATGLRTSNHTCAVITQTVLKISVLVRNGSDRQA
jgi:hypothetical protein